ncbi:7529_t:CDS:2 [Scutellospora calospora]|uniref:7529_t:CDS:1 n=1 Tax=Scutellospora calospora TaxID=85575 RepID=A0ACA9KFD6_9GLOM|nr:7529_t:CDS:2 [Scutellospora calospora]
MKYKAIYTLLGLICFGLLTCTTSTPLSPWSFNQPSSREFNHNNQNSKDHSKNPSQNSLKNPSKNHSKNTSQNLSKNHSKNTFKNPYQNTFKNPSKNTFKNPYQNTSKNPSKNTPYQNTSKNPSKSSSGASPTQHSSSNKSDPHQPSPPPYSSNSNFDIFQPLLPLDNYGPTTRDYTFICKRTNLAPDGVEREVWTVNGQYPGPIIQANIGDTIKVTVINEFKDPTGIHMHGIFMNETNWFDGVPGMTQCPQISGTTFTYTFTVNQYGTYWYHSHFVAQYVDGLKGPIVIHDPEDPYLSSYDFEYVMTVSDWYHDPTGNFMPIFLSYQGNDPVPDSGEISGVGRYSCSNTTLPCKDNGYATYKVQKGKRYRFRIINTSAMAHFVVSIDNHPMTIIECEGTNVQKHTVDFLPINIAERYSVIIDCNQPVNNYWIRASMSRCSIPYQPGDPDTINSNSSLNYDVRGILSYDGAPKGEPQSTGVKIPKSQCYDQDVSTLKPYPPQPPPQSSTSTLELAVNVGFVQPSDVLEATVNGSSYVPDFKEPTIMKLKNGIDPSKFFRSDNAYGYDFPHCAVVDLIIRNLERRTHPFHLHGHNFWVICQGEAGSFNKSLGSLEYNLVDPPLRDIVTVKPQRYIACNPGIWAFHCHIEWHVEMGMVAQLIESPDIFIKNQLPKMPRQISEFCNKYDNEKPPDNPISDDSTHDSGSPQDNGPPPPNNGPSNDTSSQSSPDNSSQDEPSPDNSSQDETSPDNSSQDKSSPDNSSQDKSSQDNSSKDKSSPDHSSQKKPKKAKKPKQTKNNKNH